jgi:hypothetical protein
MQPDYYAVLGIPPHADLAVIKAAYRARARIAHPDRGGSDRQMFAVNEAWAVLSDPKTRGNYDGARAQGLTVEARPRPPVNAGAPAPDAAVAAGLPGWLTPFAWGTVFRNDLARARYGVRKFYFAPWPTVSHSLSGTVFLIAGTIGGIVVAGEIFEAFAFEALLRWGLSALAIVYGTWMGVWAHQYFRKEALASLQRSQQAASGLPDGVVICPWCGLRLRVPARPAAAVRVTCPSCHYAFMHPEEQFSAD